MKPLGNICIVKIWEDELSFETKLNIQTEYVNAWQRCYFDDSSFRELRTFLLDYCRGHCHTNYYESLPKQGNYGPSFSMLLSGDHAGHITIEMDLEEKMQTIVPTDAYATCIPSPVFLSSLQKE